MGVDIAFYIEVRNQENWVRLHFKPPFKTKEEPYQSYWDTDCFFCRYYHFTDFLNEARSNIRGGPKERICKEIAEHLEEDDNEDMYYSAAEIYEEYTSEHYCVRHLRDIVSGIVAACHPYVEESDVRIFYLIC